MALYLLSGSNIHRDEVSVEKNVPNPLNLLTKEVIEATLKNDLGPEWCLADFEMKDFLKKGENFLTTITGLLCSGTSNGTTKETYYVAKLNPFRPTTIIDDMTNNFFFKEGSFLTQLSGKLNKILNDIGHPIINVPECVYFSSTKGREVLISKDLRTRGFRMYDINVGMDLTHSELLVKELAKLHASSSILEKKEPRGILEVYPFLNDKYLVPDSDGNVLINCIMKTTVKTTLKLIKDMPEYDRHRMWLESIKDVAGERFFKDLLDCGENMRVISHGDCWNNNMVFRYDAEGKPIEIALLDLQICRYASVALDLNYFLYSSMTGEMRNTHYDHLLSVYYKEFQDVLTAAKVANMPFTEKELRKELRDRAFWGILGGLHLLPVILNKGDDDAFDFNKLTNKEELEGGIQVLYNSILKSAETNLVFRSRFFAVLDDALKMGLADE